MLLLLFTLYDEKTRTKLEDIYHTYRKTLYIIAYSILKDHHEAQDVVQETIIRIANHLDKVEIVDSKKTKAYLSIITRNLSINIYNKKKKLVISDTDDIEEYVEINTLLYQDNFSDIANKSTFQSKLKHLHPSYADILTLKFYFELEIFEIANVLGISANNASVRLSRALNALKSTLIEREAELNEKYIWKSRKN